jgi:serine/threonine protein kinase
MPDAAPPKPDDPVAATIDAPTAPVSGSPSPSPVPRTPAHADPESIGPFRILERIGEGGMGIIYKAEQRSPVRRIVALKVIRLILHREAEALITGKSATTRPATRSTTGPQ